MRTLLITSVLPWPLRHNGGAQRSALLRDALARHGTVDILAVGGAELRENTPDFDARLTAANVVGCIVRKGRPAVAPWYMPGPLGSMSRTVQGFVGAYARDDEASARLDQLMRDRPYDLIVSRYLQPAMQCGIDRYRNVPTILDFDDIDWLTLAAQIAAKPWGGVTGRMASRRVIARVTALGEAALKNFDHVLVTSAEDAALLKRSATVLPNIPFSDSSNGWIEPLPAADSAAQFGERLLFVGDLQFPPNRDGLDRFLAKVWPAVRSARPSATLAVVGRGLSDANRAKWSQHPGVDVIGFAPDLQACYRDCAMTVVPIYFGGGTKIKILESLAFGRAVVTTPQSMRGYAALRGVAVAEDDERFARALIHLLANPSERLIMAEQGRADVVLHFSPLRFQRVIDEVMNALGAKVPGAVPAKVVERCA